MLKKTFKAPLQLAGDEGSFEAVFATFNAIDHDQDVTLPGAFRQGQRVVIEPWNHDRGLPVGEGFLHSDDRVASVQGRFFLQSTAGRDHYETVKAMRDVEWSYTFDIVASEPGKFQGKRVRYLIKLDVWGVGPVTRAAGCGTHLASIKGRGRARLTPAGVLARIDAAEMTVKLERAQATIDTWRALESSKRDRARIRSALIDGPVPTNADVIRDALRAQYPEQSEPWIEAMLAGELQAIADRRYRDTELQPFVSPNWAYEYEQVLAWAAQPAR